MTTAHRAPEPVPYASADDYIGERVSLEMRRRRMSQLETAPMLGMSQSNLSKKLAGQRGWSADEILVVSRFFGLTLEELMPGSDYVPQAWANEESPLRTAPGGGSTFVLGSRYGIRDSNPEPAGLKPERWLTLVPAARAELADVVVPTPGPVTTEPRTPNLPITGFGLPLRLVTSERAS